MTDLMLSLEITALGMGLVFGAILLLWLTMSLLATFTADKEPASTSKLEPAPVATDHDLKQLAALAVAVALAEQEQSSARPLPDPPTAIVSAWQLGMRTRQMYEKGHR